METDAVPWYMATRCLPVWRLIVSLAVTALGWYVAGYIGGFSHRGRTDRWGL